jgi:hypothetical protein
MTMLKVATDTSGVSAGNRAHALLIGNERIIIVRSVAAGTPVAQRWASFVLGAIDAESDPKTVTMWAHAVGVSRSVLSECCRLIHVPTHDARDFARFLRAICRAGEQWQPEAVLDVADARTLRKLHAGAGLSTHTETTPTIRQFLEQQRWIPSANPGLVALSSLLFDVTRDLGIPANSR